jgi:hypothetical protein
VGDLKAIKQRLEKELGRSVSDHTLLLIPDEVEEYLTNGSERAWGELLHVAEIVLRAEGVFKQKHDNDLSSSNSEKFAEKMQEPVRLPPLLLIKGGERRASNAIRSALGYRATAHPGVLELRDAFSAGAQTEDPKFLMLRRLADELRERFLWSEEETIAFILHGDIPEELPITASIERLCGLDRDKVRITLVVDPGVSPDTVVLWYTKLRSKILETQANPWRDIRQTHLFHFVESFEPFGFAESHLRLDATMTQKWRAWNEFVSDFRPDWVYRDYSNFCKAYRKAKQRLLHPRTRPIGGNRMKYCPIMREPPGGE